MAQTVIVGPADEAQSAARNTVRDTAGVGAMPVHKWLVLLVVAVGGFMAALNSASLIIILPTLQQDLHTQLITIFWVLLAYVLASAVLLFVVGRLADLIGNKRIYLVGYAVFAAGSVLSASVPTHGAGGLKVAEHLRSRLHRSFLVWFPPVGPEIAAIPLGVQCSAGVSPALDGCREADNGAAGSATTPTEPRRSP